MHLTNYAINKHNSNFHADWSDADDDEGKVAAQCDDSEDEDEDEDDGNDDDDAGSSGGSDDDDVGSSDDGDSDEGGEAHEPKVLTAKEARAAKATAARILERNRRHTSRREMALAQAKEKERQRTQQRTFGRKSAPGEDDPEAAGSTPTAPSVPVARASTGFKYSAPFDDECLAEGHGSKWGFNALVKYLRKQGHDTDKMWDRVRGQRVGMVRAGERVWAHTPLQICSLCAKTMLSVLTHTRHMQRSCRVDQGGCAAGCCDNPVSCCPHATHSPEEGFFALTGFDILLTKSLRPILIEVGVRRRCIAVPHDPWWLTPTTGEPAAVAAH